MMSATQSFEAWYGTEVTNLNPFIAENTCEWEGWYQKRSSRISLQGERKNVVLFSPMMIVEEGLTCHRSVGTRGVIEDSVQRDGDEEFEFCAGR